MKTNEIPRTRQSKIIVFKGDSALMISLLGSNDDLIRTFCPPPAVSDFKKLNLFYFL